MKSPIKADVFEFVLFLLLFAGFSTSIAVIFIKPDLAANTIALASAVFSAAGVLGAYMSVREVRRDRLEKSQPFLVVEFRFRPAGIIDFVLRNTSSNIARGVVITFDPVPIALQDKPISEWSLFQHPFDMAPGAEEQNFFHVSNQFLNGTSPKKFTVTVDCQTENGEKCPTRQFKFDFDSRMGMILPPKTVDDYSKEIVDELKGIRNQLSR